MPRKSTASVGATDANGDVSMMSNATSSSTHAHPKSSRPSGGGKQDDGVGIDDLLLPRTLVTRLARGVLPANTSIQKDATLALAKSATVFISYLAHHANELTTKKTLAPQDVLKALKEIEMAGVMELGAVGEDGRLGGRLEREMEVYEDMIMRKRKGYRDKVKARESVGEENEVAAERDEPKSKKARMSEADADEEEKMLEQQLNGVSGGASGSTAAQKSKRKDKTTSGTPQVSSGKGKAVAEEDEEEEVEEEGGQEDGEEDNEHGDEDQGEEDEEEEEEDDEEDEEDEEDDGEEDEEDEEEEDDDDDDDRDVDDTPHTNGRSKGRTSLLPDGNVDAGSDDDSE